VHVISNYRSASTNLHVRFHRGSPFYKQLLAKSQPGRGEGSLEKGNEASRAVFGVCDQLVVTSTPFRGQIVFELKIYEILLNRRTFESLKLAYEFIYSHLLGSFIKSFVEHPYPLFKGGPPTGIPVSRIT